jgi:hypothetical protein
LHCIKSPNQPSIITSLNVIIPLSETETETKSGFRSFMIPVYGNPLTAHVIVFKWL